MNGNKPQSRMVDAAGTRFLVRESGSGRPILFVHGFPLDGSMWDAQLTSLHNYHCIAPDLRGFGESEGAGQITSMEQFADDLAMMLDAMKISQPIVFVGLSMGGYIAWQFWKRHANRLGALVLSNTRAAADPSELAAVRRANAIRAESEGTGFVVDSMMPKMFAPATGSGNPSLVAGFRSMMDRAPMKGVAGALRGMAEREDANAWLADIRVPALVIAGSEDQIAGPTEMEGIARAMPNAKFVVVSGSGHLTPAERPDEFNRALTTFLQGLKT